RASSRTPTPVCPIPRPAARSRRGPPASCACEPSSLTGVRGDEGAAPRGWERSPPLEDGASFRHHLPRAREPPPWHPPGLRATLEERAAREGYASADDDLLDVRERESRGSPVL